MATLEYPAQWAERMAKEQCFDRGHRFVFGSLRMNVIGRVNGKRQFDIAYTFEDGSGNYRKSEFYAQEVFVDG